MTFDESKASTVKRRALQDVRETVSEAHLMLVSLVTDLSNCDASIVTQLVDRLNQGVRTDADADADPDWYVIAERTTHRGPETD
jgi:hypothetical protein